MFIWIIQNREGDSSSDLRTPGNVHKKTYFCSAPDTEITGHSWMAKIFTWTRIIGFQNSGLLGINLLFGDMNLGYDDGYRIKNK